MTKKYRFMNNLKNQTGVKFNRAGRIPKLRQWLAQRQHDIRTSVQNLLSRDDNSRMTAGKKDVFRGEQKRFLLHSMKTLHEKYKSEVGSFSLSYSKFCKLRQPHIRPPTVKDREVCVCRICDNVQLLLDKLYALKIVAKHSMDDLIPSLVCHANNKDCMYHSCPVCKTRKVKKETAFETRSNDKTSWLQWRNQLIEYQKEGVTYNTKKVEKETVTGTVQHLLECLENDLQKYLPHRYRIYHQYSALESLKVNLTDNSALVHVDFSENFTCKYSKEITQVHFGASNVQATLHDGIVYTNGKAQAFCSISSSNVHEAPGVWAHLTPVLRHIRDSNPGVDTLHLLTDGPSSQYKNKTSFFLATDIPKELGYKSVI